MTSIGNGNLFEMAKEIITYAKSQLLQEDVQTKKMFPKPFKIKFEHNKRYRWKQSKVFMVSEFVVELKSS